MVQQIYSSNSAEAVLRLLQDVDLESEYQEVQMHLKKHKVKT